MNAVIKKYKLPLLATCTVVAIGLGFIGVDHASANMNMYPKCNKINGEECREGNGPVTCETRDGNEQTCTCKKKGVGFRWSCSAASYEAEILDTPLDGLDI